MKDHDRKFEGVWWLPSDPEKQWDGILMWRPTRSPRLKLKYRSVGQDPPPREAEAFLGLDEGGTPITVLRAGCSGGSGSGFLSNRKYSAGHILRGIHVESLKGFRANRVDFWLQNLGAWVTEEGFDRADNGNEEWRISYRRRRKWGEENGVASKHLTFVSGCTPAARCVLARRELRRAANEATLRAFRYADRFTTFKIFRRPGFNRKTSRV